MPTPVNNGWGGRSLYTCSFGLALSFVVVVMFSLTHKEINSENDCGMTMMWRYISMIPIDVKDNSVKRYELYRYHEGNTEGIFIPSTQTIPVLFVPGSGGSANQVRSIASVMQNKTDLRYLPYRMHFYACSFNEELSFLSGETIRNQREFVIKSIKTIMGIYNTRTVKTEKIILIGHSFGGTVIYSLPDDPTFDVTTMSLVLTIASPLKIPPVNIDESMRLLYKNAHKAWTERKDLQHVGVVSYSGGIKDIQVPDRLSDLRSSKWNGHFFPSWSVPGVGFDADHLCILWCNELVVHQSRLLERYAKYWRDERMTGRKLLDEHYSNVIKERSSVKKWSNSRRVLRGLLWPWTEEKHIISTTALEQTHVFEVNLDSPDTVLVAHIRLGTCDSAKTKIAFRFSDGLRRHAPKVKNNKVLFYIPQTIPSNLGLKGDLIIRASPDCTYSVSFSTDFWWSMYMTLLNASHMIPSMLLDSGMFVACVRTASDIGVSTKRIMFVTNVALAALLAWFSTSADGARIIQIYIRLLFVVFVFVFCIGDPLRKGTHKGIRILSSFFAKTTLAALLYTVSILGVVTNIHLAMAILFIVQAARARVPSAFVGCLLCVLICVSIGLASGIREQILEIETFDDVLRQFTANSQRVIFIPYLVLFVNTAFRVPDIVREPIRNFYANSWILLPICTMIFVGMARSASLEMYMCYLSFFIPMYDALHPIRTRNDVRRE